MKGIKDHFSELSQGYQKYRPSYPKELFEFIYGHCRYFDKAWDCGTGNGQAAIMLSKKFKEVFATDISQNQLNLATNQDNITYLIQRAESTEFESDYFDLICVAQAVHWFDLDTFNTEAKRVLKPDGTLAIWGYDLIMVNQKIDMIVDQFYNKTVGEYWNKERKSIEKHYEDLDFTFEEIPVKYFFEFKIQWSLDHFIGYISSWSAVKNFKKSNGSDPTIKLRENLSEIWNGERTVIFPIFLRLFKKPY